MPGGLPGGGMGGFGIDRYIIYGWKMRHIRHAMIDVLRKLFAKQNQANL